MTKTYDNLGVQFLYPENWTITEESGSGWPRSVELQTPENAFWVLQIHSRSTPKELTAQVLKTMGEEYQEMETDTISEWVEKAHVVGYEMRFYCLDLIVTSTVRGWRHENNNYLVMFQAEDRDFDRLNPVFQAMIMTIIRNQNQKHHEE